jgi:hypothetical protein
VASGHCFQLLTLMMLTMTLAAPPCLLLQLEKQLRIDVIFETVCQTAAAAIQTQSLSQQLSPLLLHAMQQ